MLKLRVITALVLFFAAIYCIFFLSNAMFALVMGIVVLLGAYEWAGFARFPSQLAKLAFVFIVATVIYSIWLVNFILSSQVMNFIAAAFWLMNFILVVKYPGSASFWKSRPLIIALIGILLLTLTWYSVISVHAIQDFEFGQSTLSGSYLLFFSLMLVWSADTGAYFSGKRFGKNKLAPQVSPGKTWEGVAGGLLLALFIAFLFSLFYHGSVQDYLNVFMITIVTVAFSVIGDLMESMFKRQTGIKDSGNLLPGHGGILDRIDGVTAAGPVFFIALSFIYLL